MTTAYTSLLGLALPVTGELSGTWGDTVNNSITSLVDTAVAGTTNVSADSNVTLTTTTGASNQARQAILLFSGARTAIRTVTAPAQSKIYTVINATTGGFAVQLVGAGPTTGVTIANGARTVVAWNGSDFVEVSSPSSIILPGGTANGVLYLNGSKVVTSGSALTFDGSKLTVKGGNAGQFVLDNANEQYVQALFQRNATINTGADFLLDGSGNTFNFRTLAANMPFTWNISATAGAPSERMRLDASGNLGLGVTPAAWEPTIEAIQVANSGASFAASNTGYSSSNFLWIGNNSYQNSSGQDIYVRSVPASQYRQLASNHVWFSADSGTAGNVITFFQVLSVGSSTSLALQGATSQSGTGITFPATQSASANANTLDDYEEGTWTPLLNGSVSLGTARYIKIGQLVFCEISGYNVNISSIGASTNLTIQGAPFSMTTYQYAAPIAQQAGINYGFYDSSSTTFNLGVGGTAADFQAITRNTFGGVGNLSFRFSFTYRADT